MTAYEIIRRSLRLCRVIDPAEAVPAAEGQDGLESLNALLSTWRLEGLLAYDIERAVFALVGGQQQYTIGPGGNWDTTPLFGVSGGRPVRIDSMGLVDATQTPALEIPMTPLSQRDYQHIALKSMQSSWPTHFSYSPLVPLGSVYLWPSPTVAYSVAVYLWHSLQQFPTIHTDVTLPDGYEEALIYNLARRVAPEYGVSLLPDVILTAMESKGLVMKAADEPVLLDPDPLVPGLKGRGTLNWISGEIV